MWDKKDVHQKISGLQILYQYKSKKHELDCFSPFVQIRMPIPIIGNSFPCNWLLCLSLYQHRSKKNYFTLFGSLVREACNKMKVWLPTRMIILLENILFIDMWPTSLRRNRTVLQWIILVICTNYTWSWKSNKTSATCNIWVWSYLQEKKI